MEFLRTTENGKMLLKEFNMKVRSLGGRSFSCDVKSALPTGFQPLKKRFWDAGGRAQASWVTDGR